MDNLIYAFIRGGIQAAEAETISNLFIEKAYRKNDYLLRPGIIADKIFFIESGSVMLGVMTDKKPVISTASGWLSITRLRTIYSPASAVMYGSLILMSSI